MMTLTQIHGLSAEDARTLILRLQMHIEGVEASMTPSELREHLKDVPDQLYREADQLSWRLKNEMHQLVTNYAVRHLDWEQCENDGEYTTDDGECDRDLVADDFYEEISRLSNELLGEFFGHHARDEYDFGSVNTNDDEIERMAIEIYCKNHEDQPCSALTQVFSHNGELFVRLANVNGPLQTSRVVAVHDKIFLQELDADELEAVEAAAIAS